MPQSKPLARIIAPLAATVILATSCAGNAMAQAYAGCYVGGQQVADSQCSGGGSGAGGGLSPMQGAAIGAAGSIGYALGAALGSMLRDAMTDPNPGGSDEDSAAAAAAQQISLQRAMATKRQQEQQRQAEQQEQQRQFRQNQQELLNEVRSLGGGSASGGLAPADLGANTGSTTSLQPRQLETSPSGDSSVVDLSGVGTTTVDPRAVKGTSAAPRPAVDALQLSTIDDMRYLFPDEPSLWPGPRNAGARMINPLREPERYQALLVAEEAQFPDQRDQIEKLRASLDSDAAKRQRLAAIGDQIAKEYNASVTSADRSASSQLAKILASAEKKNGVADHESLFEKAHSDAALSQSLRDQARPVLAARAKAVAAADDRAYSELYRAFDRIDPGAGVTH